MALIVVPTYYTSLPYRRAALQMWKRNVGSKATYRELIDLFKQAGYQDYAKAVHEVLFGSKLYATVTFWKSSISQLRWNKLHVLFL